MFSRNDEEVGMSSVPILYPGTGTDIIYSFLSPRDTGLVVSPSLELSKGQFGWVGIVEGVSVPVELDEL